MNKIGELLAEHCCEGVKFRKLGEIATYPKARIQASDIDENSYVGVANLLPEMQGKTKSMHVPSKGVCTGYEIDDLLIGNIRPYLKKIWMADSSGGSSQDVVVIRVREAFSGKVIPRFLYYILASDDFFSYSMSYAKGTRMPRGDKRVILKYPVPIPPLVVQHEIVDILDTFSELQAELQARQKQYRHYRDKLTSFKNSSHTGSSQIDKLLAEHCPDGVEFKELGEVAIYPKARIQASELDENKYVGVANLLPEMRGKTKSIHVPSKGTCPSYEIGDILIGNIRPYLKKIWLADALGGVGQQVLIIRIREGSYSEIIPTFLYYLLASDDFFSYNTSYVKGVTRPCGDKKAIMKYPIPIPPLVVQQEIVSILDKFDALVNDLSDGLPAEIIARRKQYEYYRDKLLTFKEAE